MTPKEKAQELVHKFKCYTGRYYNSKRNTITSKQCALIAVDEITRYTYMGKAKSKNDDNSFEYWQEVKQEIEKL